MVLWQGIKGIRLEALFDTLGDPIVLMCRKKARERSGLARGQVSRDPFLDFHADSPGSEGTVHRGEPQFVVPPEPERRTQLF